MTHQLLIIKLNVFWSVSPAFYKKVLRLSKVTHDSTSKSVSSSSLSRVTGVCVYNYSVMNFLYLRANFVISLEFTPFLDVVTGRNVG